MKPPVLINRAEIQNGDADGRQKRSLGQDHQQRHQQLQPAHPRPVSLQLRCQQHVAEIGYGEQEKKHARANQQKCVGLKKNRDLLHQPIERVRPLGQQRVNVGGRKHHRDHGEAERLEVNAVDYVKQRTRRTQKIVRREPLHMR